MLTAKDIQEFKDIYESTSKKRLSTQEATQLAHRLLSFYRAVYTPKQVNKPNQVEN